MDLSQLNKTELILAREARLGKHVELDHAIGEFMKEQHRLHQEITEIEHEEARRNLNPDRSLDQTTTPGKRG